MELVELHIILSELEIDGEICETEESIEGEEVEIESKTSKRIGPRDRPMLFNVAKNNCGRERLCIINRNDNAVVTKEVGEVTKSRWKMNGPNRL